MGATWLQQRKWGVTEISRRRFCGLLVLPPLCLFFSADPMALMLAATSASALIAGSALPYGSMRTAPLVMQVGPTEQDGAWTFRHGPGVIADQGALGWAVAGGPGEYVGKVMPLRGHGMHHLPVPPENGPMRTKLPAAAAQPAIPAANPTAMVASSSAVNEEAAKAAWLAGARGTVADATRDSAQPVPAAHVIAATGPTEQGPYNYQATAKLTENGAVWSFRHGPGQLQPLSSGGP